jgi:hypothetical protein
VYNRGTASILQYKYVQQPDRPFSLIQSEAFGGNGCCSSGNTTAGCCGSCCDDSFNEDSFDKHMAKSGAEPKASQPAPAGEMTVPVSAGGDTKDA